MGFKFYLYIFLQILICHATYCQNQVFIKSGNKDGQGILLRREDRCFVLTPEHVINETGSVNISLRNDRVIVTDKMNLFEHDIALLSIEKSEKLSCPNLQVAKDFKKLTETATSAVLESSNQAGATRYLHVDIVEADEDYFTVRPRNGSDKIDEGMSGSGLNMTQNGEKIFLGMLLSVDENGRGRVANTDLVMQTLKNFLKADETKKIQIVGSSETLKNDFTLAQTAAQILKRKYPDIHFVAIDDRSQLTSDAICYISTKTDVDNNNKIDSKISKYKTKLDVSIVKNGKKITSQSETSGGIDYDPDIARKNAIINSLETIKID